MTTRLNDHFCLVAWHLSESGSARGRSSKETVQVDRKIITFPYSIQSVSIETPRTNSFRPQSPVYAKMTRFVVKYTDFCKELNLDLSERMVLKRHILTENMFSLSKRWRKQLR